MSINQKGEGKVGLVIGLTVLFSTIFVAWRLIPIMLDVYSFEDKFREECKYIHGRKMDELIRDIVKDGQQKNLNLTEENVTAVKVANSLKANVNFVQPIDFEVYTYQWEINFDYDAPIFE